MRAAAACTALAIVRVGRPGAARPSPTIELRVPARDLLRAPSRAAGHAAAAHSRTDHRRSAPADARSRSGAAAGAAGPRRRGRTQPRSARPVRHGGRRRAGRLLHPRAARSVPAPAGSGSAQPDVGGRAGLHGARGRRAGRAGVECAAPAVLSELHHDQHRQPWRTDRSPASARRPGLPLRSPSRRAGHASASSTASSSTRRLATSGSRTCAGRPARAKRRPRSLPSCGDGCDRLAGMASGAAIDAAQSVPTEFLGGSRRAVRGAGHAGQRWRSSDWARYRRTRSARGCSSKRAPSGRCDPASGSAPRCGSPARNWASPASRWIPRSAGGRSARGSRRSSSCAAMCRSARASAACRPPGRNARRGSRPTPPARRCGIRPPRNCSAPSSPTSRSPPPNSAPRHSATA